MAATDTWSHIQLFKKRHSAFKSKLKDRRRKRNKCLYELGLCEKAIDEKSPTTAQLLPAELDALLERQIIECLLSPVLDLPQDVSSLLEKAGFKPTSAVLMCVLDRLSCQDLVVLQGGSKLVVTSVNLDRVSRIAETLGITGRQNEFIMPTSFKSVEEEVEWLVNTSSVRDQESHRVGTEIQELLSAKSVKEQLMLEKFKTAGGSQLREFCPHKTRDDCRRSNNTGRSCNKLHFRKIIHSHTDESLGDCSFLNTCFHVETCKFVHYEVESVQDPGGGRSRPKPTGYHPSSGTRLELPQWINCDLRYFDMSILGKFSVVMADPPWDIHMELPYGTMGDDEMRQLNIPALQDNGFIFLWVTGRAMELGRECLTLWGYERINELIWVKTNQLQRLIRTGRTGHWINHGKEHCLIGVKGEPAGCNIGIDCDVIVAEVRATSHKPDEVYGLIERLSPGTRKIELFGRAHNCQPNWVTLGNQLEGVVLYDDDLRNGFYKRYPREEMAMMATPAPQQ